MKTKNDASAESVESKKEGEQKKRKGLSDYKKTDLMQLPHDRLIPDYIEQAHKTHQTYRSRFRAIFGRGIEQEVLEKYFLDKWSAAEIAKYYNISQITVSKFLLDYIMRSYDDSKIEEMSALDSENHLGVLDSFFASVLYVAKDAAMNAIVQKKLRQELAAKIAGEGILEAVKDKNLMRAIEQSSARTERYANLAIKHLQTYLNLMEQVLNRQRDVALVRVLFDLLQRLEPEAHEKLAQALEQDEYAQAVLKSLPGTTLVSVFKRRQTPEDFAKKLEEDTEALLNTLQDIEDK